MRAEISKEELEEPYLEQKLSCRRIGKLLDCKHDKISELLKQNKTKLRTKTEERKLIRMPVKYRISKEALEKHYWKDNLSPYQIAKQHKCSSSCIFYKMKKHDIPLRTLSEGIELSIPRRSNSLAKANIIYERRDFEGSNEDKAYLIGFRIGDLHVKKNKYGETIYVSSGTSKQVQVDLMNSLFGGYGKVKVYELKSGCKQFSCGLNTSFEFLLEKKDCIPQWIFSDEQLFIAFLAGYIDAEGHFGVYNGFAEFSVSSYEKNILFQISQKLNLLGVQCAPPKMNFKKGYTDKRGVSNHNDLWRLRITKKAQITKVVEILKPCLRHSKRLNDLMKVEQSIIERNKRL